MSEEKQIFTLKQVANSIRKIIAERYQQNYWVQAEMHKLNHTSKGHCYPELVHKEDGQILAEMRGTIWASTYEQISRKFANTVKEPLREGLNLLLLVKISFHPIYGIGLEILDIDPTFSLGELQKERLETLRRLNEEGILNQNQQLPFPLLPKRIAIISIDSSKGLSDFYSVTESNAWNYRFFFMLFPAQLNGDAAIESIQRQLKRIEKVKHHFDLVLIIRGGGGEIGMSCYNNYHLAKAIATFPLPVMTGIGHSTNITVSEMVAYQNAITPTELAEKLIQCFHEFAVPLSEGKKTILRKTKTLIELKKNELRSELRFIGKVSENLLTKMNSRLIRSSHQLQQQTKAALNAKNFTLEKQIQLVRSGSKNLQHAQRIELDRFKANLGKFSMTFFDHENKRMAELKFQIKPNTDRLLENLKLRLQTSEKSIHLVDPIQVLKRGYSLTLKNGKLISENNPVLEGDLIETKTAREQIFSEVKTIKKEKHE